MGGSAPTEPTGAAPAAEPAIAVVETPVAALAIVETPAVVEPASPSEPAPAPEAPKPHTDTPTLLEEGAPKPGEDKTEPVATLIPETKVYGEFNLPENVRADPGLMGEFTALLGERGLDQEAGQKLVDLYGRAAETYATHLAAEQHRVFAETRSGWRTQVLADEQLGGSGHRTAMAAVARARDALVPEANRTAFNEFLRITGAGDHPEFLRLLHNAARRFDEPATPPAAPNPPPNASGRPGGLRGMYKKTG